MGVPMTGIRRRGRWCAALTATALLLAACGGGGDGDGAGDDGDAEATPEPGTDGEVDGEGEGEGGGDATGPEGTLRIDALLDPVSLDPLRFNSIEAQRIYRLVYDSLLAWQDDGSLAPALASEVPEPDDDGVTYTVSLRDDVTWHDGADFTAEDVVFTFETVKDPENASVWGQSLAFLDTVEAVDDVTVRFTLSEPFTLFPAKLAMVPIISSSTDYVPNETLASEMNGTGAFRFVEWRQGEIIRLEANPDHHDGGPGVQDVEIHTVPENATRLANLANGITHILPDVPVQQLSLAEDAGDVTVLDDSVITIFAFASMAEDRPTSDPAMRIAIAAALDREAMVEQALGGVGEPASTVLASGTPEWDEDLGTFYAATGDLDLAEQALADAGGAPDQPLQLVVRNRPDLVQLATIMQASLARVGIDVEVSAEEAAAYLPRLLEGDYDLLIIQSEVGGTVGWTPDYVYLMYRSGAPTNFNGFSDARMDELLDEAVRADEADQADAWRAVQEHELETHPVIPLVTARYVEAVGPQVQGYQPSPLTTLVNLVDARITED